MFANSKFIWLVELVEFFNFTSVVILSLVQGLLLEIIFFSVTTQYLENHLYNTHCIFPLHVLYNIIIIQILKNLNLKNMFATFTQTNKESIGMTFIERRYSKTNTLLQIQLRKACVFIIRVYFYTK